MIPLCIYHANCADGFTAAWAVRAALGDRVEFLPASYGSEPPDVAGRDVIIVDFSYPPLCWSCEQYGWRKGPINKNPDHRLIKQIAVLAEALESEANVKIYGGRRYG